jgi:glycosyltransferase involved in cell wall biosynthesis
MNAPVDVLIPTCRRPAALAVTLACLVGQDCRPARIVISDQTEGEDATAYGEVQAVLRVLRLHGSEVELHRHLPNRGMAEQRQFLLDRATAPYVLYLDDDLVLEPDVIGRMLAAIREEECGFVGCAVIGLSYLEDVRPDEQTLEFWDGPVRPERITPGDAAWQRYTLHNAANLYHVQQRLRLDRQRTRKYRVAWVGGCVLYDADKLRAAGGFRFWRDLPREHCGEDVLAQLRVMARDGGCGLLPSGAYHQELPTAVEDRCVNAPLVLGLED